MILIRYINSTFEEEIALYDVITESIIKKGDYYHDKINEWIEGFIKGLQYLGGEVALTEVLIHPEDEMFEKLGLYNETY